MQSVIFKVKIYNLKAQGLNNLTYTLHHFELLMGNFNAYNFTPLKVGRRIYIQNNTYA